MAALQIYRGDTKQINLSFTNSSGTPFNLSGYYLVFTVKQSYMENDAVISVVQTGYESAESGKMSILLSGSQTDICPGNYLAMFSLVSGASVSTYNTEGLTILPSLYQVL